MYLIIKILTVLAFSEPSLGTPLIALREAPDNCDGCHRGGRSQKPFLLRRGTLDCQGCHVDPSGAGPRNEWGFYYSHDQMAMINFITPIDPLQDESFFDIHVDSRIANVQSGSNNYVFPMALEATFRLKPFKDYLSASYTAQMLGRTNDSQYRVVTTGDRRYREKYALMVDALPLNTYVRSYRGTPMYGLRRPNHTLWIRERIGLGPFATTEAIEAGGTPNVPYWHYSQMTGDPYAEASERQKGTSYHAGMRGVTLGWHLNVSGWDTKSETHAVEMSAFGVGTNIFGVLLYHEQNTRTVTALDEFDTAANPTRLHPTNKITESTLAYSGILGLMVGAIWETYQDASKSSNRLNYFIDFHPIPFVQMELWIRRETGEREYSDSMFITHFYADF